MGSAEIGGENFSCGSCGRKFKWKLAIAGKRLKCHCGEALNVPIFEEPDLAAPTIIPSRGRPIAVPSKAVGYATSQVTKTESRFAFPNLTDPVRDLYVPVALYLTGFLAALLWIALESHAGTQGLVALSLAAGLLTLIKTIVLISLALVLAPPLGISFGLFWPAILKFAAIIILNDAALLWLETWLKAIGGISASGQAPYQIIYVRLGLAATIISCCSYYLFNMDLDEVAMFAVPMAIISWLTGFVLALMLLPTYRASVKPPAWSAVKVPVPAVASASSSPSASPSPTPSPGPLPTSAPTGIIQVPSGQRSSLLQRTIVQRIYKDGPYLHEGRQWEKSTMADPATNQLIDQLFTAGAGKVYVEAPPTSAASKVPPLLRLYVEEPQTDAGQAACQQAYITFRKTSGTVQFSHAISAGQFLLIDIIR